MVTGQQVRRLFKLMNREESLNKAAMKADMDEGTARKYLSEGQTPGDLKKAHTWQTRVNPYEKYWDEITEMLKLNYGLEAKTIFEYLQAKYPGELKDGQLRTLQRKIKEWRVLSGERKQEVYFTQIHKPGVLCESDFTHMDDLGVTIGKELFRHMIYHFVLTYSNWEDGTICYTESFQSLSEGLQNALYRLGGVPEEHRTDQLSAAVQRPDNREEFTNDYNQLMEHYKINGRKTQPYSPNENGDIEQRHYRFKKKVDQQLMVRGSRDFNTLEEYKEFLANMFRQSNRGRHSKLQEELDVMKDLPDTRLENCKELKLSVSTGSTITVLKNIYSVNSSLIGEQVTAYVYADYILVKYKHTLVEKLPRFRGSGKHKIQYPHVIEWLIRKPGAFNNYKYKEDMFPTSYFRMAFDKLNEQHSDKTAVKHYLKILHLAARISEEKVNKALKDCIETGKSVNPQDIEKLLTEEDQIPNETPVIEPVDIKQYQELVDGGGDPCCLN